MDPDCICLAARYPNGDVGSPVEPGGEAVCCIWCACVCDFEFYSAPKWRRIVDFGFMAALDRERQTIRTGE
jgi:hypothetical protein